MQLFQISENKNIDNPTLKNYYYLLSKCKLELSKSILAWIRSKLTDIYKNLNLEDLINKITENDLDLINYKIDMNYSYKDKKNKDLQRSQKLVIFGLKEIQLFKF